MRSLKIRSKKIQSPIIKKGDLITLRSPLKLIEEEYSVTDIKPGEQYYKSYSNTLHTLKRIIRAQERNELKRASNRDLFGLDMKSVINVEVHMSAAERFKLRGKGQFAKDPNWTPYKTTNEEYILEGATD